MADTLYLSPLYYILLQYNNFLVQGFNNFVLKHSWLVQHLTTLTVVFKIEVFVLC